MGPARVSTTNSSSRDGAGGAQIAREDADAVAAHLRLAAVRVEDAHAGDRPGNGSRGSATQKDAVAAGPVVPVTDQPDGLHGERPRKSGLLQDEVVVAQTLPLGEAHREPPTLSQEPAGPLRAGPRTTSSATSAGVRADTSMITASCSRRIQVHCLRT